MALNNVKSESAIEAASPVASPITLRKVSPTASPTSTSVASFTAPAIVNESKYIPAVPSILQKNIDEIKMELSSDLIKQEPELDIKTEIETQEFEVAIDSCEEGYQLYGLEATDAVNEASILTSAVDIEEIRVQKYEIPEESNVSNDYQNDEMLTSINAEEDDDFLTEYEGSISEGSDDDSYLDEVSSQEMKHSEMKLLKPLKEHIQLKTNRKDQGGRSKNSRTGGKVLVTLPLKTDRKGQGGRSKSSRTRDKVRKALAKKTRFLCDKCNRDFSTKHNLNRHLITHGGLKPFKCKVCSKEFTQNATLKQHMLIHAGLKPYKCEVCSKAFAQNGTLKQHMLIHTGEKPYVCEFCNRAFNQSKSLVFHLRRHTGEKPFHCEFCKLDFRLKDGLKNHILRYHMGDSIGNKFLCIICKKVMDKKTDLQLHMKKHVNNHRSMSSEALENGEQNAEVILELINENDEC